MLYIPLGIYRCDCSLGVFVLTRVACLHMCEMMKVTEEEELVRNTLTWKQG